MLPERPILSARLEHSFFTNQSHKNSRRMLPTKGCGNYSYFLKGR